MRLVAVADTHGYQSGLNVPDGDVFIHAGDMLRRGTLDELAPVGEWIQKLPHPHKIVVAGNHDWCFARETQAALDLLGPGVHYLQDSGVEIDGVRFWGSPWQPRFLDWAFNLERGKALADKWALIPSDVHVLVTHGPPRGFGDRVTSGQSEGCDDLLEALARVQPKLHLFGHIHEDGGAWQLESTCISNVTTRDCERGATVLDVGATVSPVVVPPPS